MSTKFCENPLSGSQDIHMFICDRLTDRLTYRLTDRLTYRLTDYQTNAGLPYTYGRDF